MKPQQLSYQDMALDPTGQIMSRELKASLRKQYGYCLTCPSVPTLLFDVQKARLNPLWSNKVPRTVDGVCFEGKCFQCHPRLRHLHSGSGSSTNVLDGAGNKSVHSAGSGGERRAGRRPGRGQQNNNNHTSSRRLTVRPTQVSSSSLLSQDSLQSQQQPLQQQSQSQQMQQQPPHRASSGRTLSGRSISVTGPDEATAVRSADAVPARVATTPLSRHNLSASSSLDLLTDDDLDCSGHNGSPTTVTVSPPPRRRRSPPMVRAGSEESLVLVPLSDHSPPQHPTSSLALSSSSLTSSSGPGTVLPRVPLRTGSRRPVGSNPASSHSSHRHHVAPSCVNNSTHSSSTMDVSRSGVPLSLPVVSSASDCRNHPNLGASHHTHPDHDHDDVLASCGTDATGAGIGPGAAPEAATSRPNTDDDSAIQGLQTLVREMPGDENLGILTEILISSLDLHRASERVQAHVLQAMADLFQDTVTESHVLVSKIWQAMTDFATSLSVQTAGCRALRSLASHSGNTGILVQTRACHALAAALSRHIGDADLVEVAVATLRMLSIASEARDQLQRHDVASQVAQAMLCNPHGAALQRDGCALLSNIAVDPERRTVSPVGATVLEAVVGALKSHPNDPTVTASACFALKNLSYESTNVSALAKIPDLCESVQRAATIGGDNDALIVLERLQMAQAEAESLQEQTLAVITNTDSIEDVVNAMKSNCRSPKVVQESMKALTALVRASHAHKTLLQQDGEVLACMLQCSELYASDLQIQDLTRTLMDAILVFDDEEEALETALPAPKSPETQLVNTD